MRVDPRKDFTDTITSLKQARQLAPDDTGERRVSEGASYVLVRKYEEDMDNVLKAFNLLKRFQDRTATTLRVLAIIFGGACTLAVTIAAVYGALHSG